ncbi:hypothetical protein [Nonomuraea sp. LPB2021202275-12-8]|uniref:hypothetical protein n=1 Tax=Nonomuraea sp. LPB2021202275-12-8 TaxID=3120159 RepID=UPI00300C4816
MTAVLTVSLRETRVLAERMLLLLGVPKGMVPSVREVIVEAEALGLGGLDFLDSGPARSWLPPSLHDRTVVEAHGMPAPYVTPALIDLGVALLHEHGTAKLTLHGVSAPHLLAVLPHAARPYGAAIEVGGDDRTPVITVTHGPVADGLPEHLARAVHEGLTVEAALWWRLYHRSNDALTEDTPISRSHAGATLDTAGAEPDADIDYMAVNP